MKEGNFITLGINGFADIGISDSKMIARNHTLITIQNGELILKDASVNGGTSRVRNTKNLIPIKAILRIIITKKIQQKWKFRHAHNTGNSSANNNAKIIDYKKLLNIPEDTLLTADILQKAYCKKCLEWHSNRHPENIDECTEMMKKLNEAKDALDKLITEDFKIINVFFFRIYCFIR